MFFQEAVVKNKQNRFSMKAVGFQTHSKAFCGRIFLTLVYNNCIVNDKRATGFFLRIYFFNSQAKNFDKKLLFIIAILKKRCILYDQISETHTTKDTAS